MHSYLERLSELPSAHALGKLKAPVNNYKIRLVQMVERGPRKGPSDFIPVRLRFRVGAEREIGTIEGLNPLDTRSNLQADHDGDKIRSTHDFSSTNGKEHKW